MQPFQKILVCYNHLVANIRKNRSTTFLAQNQNEHARREADRAIQLNPSLTEAYYLRARARYRLLDHDGAIDDYSTVLRLGDCKAEVYLNRGLAYYAKGDIADAFGDLNMAIYRNPKLAFAYNCRGLVDELQGNLSGAIADYTQAIRLNPDIDTIYTNRGSARASWGDLRGAIADYQHYLAVGGGKRHGDQSRIEGLIGSLKGQLEQSASH